LILGLAHTETFPAAAANLRIEGDSQLIINQVSGKWKIKNDVLKRLHTSVLEILNDSAFLNVGIQHVYRDQNKHADKLTNDVMKTNESFYKRSHS
jgi:ribonuclease HI